MHLHVQDSPSPAAAERVARALSTSSRSAPSTSSLMNDGRRACLRQNASRLVVGTSMPCSASCAMRLSPSVPLARKLAVPSPELIASGRTTTRSPRPLRATWRASPRRARRRGLERVDLAARADPLAEQHRVAAEVRPTSNTTSPSAIARGTRHTPRRSTPPGGTPRPAVSLHRLETGRPGGRRACDRGPLRTAASTAPSGSSSPEAGEMPRRPVPPTRAPERFSLAEFHHVNPTTPGSRARDLAIHGQAAPACGSRERPDVAMGPSWTSGVGLEIEADRKMDAARQEPRRGVQRAADETRCGAAHTAVRRQLGRARFDGDVREPCRSQRRAQRLRREVADVDEIVRERGPVAANQAAAPALP